MARRVNKKFLIILTLLVVGLGISALLANKFLFRESPEKYVVYGQQLMSEQKYEEAVKNFGHAVALDQKNPSLWVAYGDAMNQLSPTDIEFMAKARKAWENALALDVNNKPALDRIMQFWSDVANMDATRPEVFERLHDTATRLYQADPQNTAAEVAMVTSVVRPWLAGVEKDRKYIEEHVAKLMELMKKYPENSELPMFAAQAKLRFAERERQRDRVDDAKALVTEAVNIIEAALARNPSAAMYFSAAQVYHTQEVLEPRAAQEWRPKKRESYAKAQAIAKPEDPLYVPIHINAAGAVTASDPAEAEKILRELMKSMPEDQQARLALAEQLARDRNKRAQAQEILEQPFAPKGMIGPKAYMVRELQTRTLVTLTNLRIEAYAAANEEERKKLLPPIQDGLSQIVQKDGDGPRALRLRGKLLRIQGHTIDAIQTLERARALAEQGGRSETLADRGERWEVVDMLARAYIDTQQTGRAKDLLTELVRHTGHDPSRMLLAQLLVKDGSYDEAAQHVEYFKRKQPDDPEVIKLSLQLMDPKNVSKDEGREKVRIQQIRDTYAKLPERTREEMLDKVNAAMVVDQPEEATRLLNKLQQTVPGDLEVARLAVRVYRNTGDLDAARAAVAVAVKANPNDEKLQLLQRQVVDLTPEGLAKVRKEEITKNPDPFLRAIGLADVARREGKPEEELQHLLAAEKLKPDNRDVTAMLFAHYLGQKQWDKAEALLEPLTRANQDQTGGLLFRYRLAMARADHKSALSYARALVQRMGEFGQSWLALGQTLQVMGQHEEALKNFLAALEKQSDSAEAFRGSIECYYALNRPTEARRKITDARRALPSNPYFLEMEISHELTYGNPENAIGPREEMVKKNPERGHHLMALGQAYLAAARHNAAKPDRQPQAAAMYGKARETFRAGLTKWPDEIAFYAYYAETAARSGDPGDTEQLLKQVAAREVWKDKVEPQMLLAEYYGITGRPADAEAALRQVIAQQPANVEVQTRLANLLMNQNKVDEALKALETNGNDPRIARARVEMLLRANRLDEAEKALDEVLARTPDNLEMLHLAASVSINRQKFAQAEQRVSRAMALDGKNPTTHYFMGLLRLNQPKADIGEAVKHLTIAKESPKMGIEARVALAECLRRRSDIDGGIRELEGALKAQPANDRVRLALIDAYSGLQPPRWIDAERVMRDARNLPNYRPDAELLQREANMWAARNEPKLAVERINEALALSPNDMELTRAALNLLVKAGRYSDVNQKVEQLVAKDKTLWWAHQARAVAQRWQGRKDEAVREFEAALIAANLARNDEAAREIVMTMGDVIGPDEAITRILPRSDGDDRFKIMVARLQQVKGDTAAAVKTVEQVLAREEQLSPADKENVYRFAGTLYLMVNQPSKSLDCYQKLLVLAPNDMTALNNTACLLGELVQPPRPQEGLEYSRRAYELMQRGGRRDPLVLDTHGWLLTLSGQVDAGIDVLRAANEIRRIPDAHYHLGEAYLRKQFADEAQRELEMALVLYKQRVQEKQPVDPTLQSKIEGAMARAGVMARQKTANAPTGTNVP